MKSFEEFLREWVEFDKKIAGNVTDKTLFPTKTKNPSENTKPMVKRLNKIMMTRKRN